MTSHFRTRLTSSQCIFSIWLCSFLIVSTAGCVNRSRTPRSQNQQTPSSIQRININTASAKELERLPGIGEELAERIVEHRRKYGPFRRAEDLIMVRGIGDARFREIRHLITVE